MMRKQMKHKMSEQEIEEILANITSPVKTFRRRLPVIHEKRCECCTTIARKREKREERLKLKRIASFKQND